MEEKEINNKVEEKTEDKVDNNITNKKFGEIFDKIAKSHTTLPLDILLSILSGIVKTSDKDNPEVIKFAEATKDCSVSDIVSKAVLFTCNSIVMNIWNTFGPDIEKAYKLANGITDEEKPINVDEINSDTGNNA